PTFLALFLVMKEPKPRIYTFSFLAKEFLTSAKKVSRVTRTSTLGTPVFSAIMLTKSAFLITLISNKLCEKNGNSGVQSSKIVSILGHRVTYIYFADIKWLTGKSSPVWPWRGRQSYWIAVIFSSGFRGRPV